MVKMTNKRFRGEANVTARDVPKWEAAGWVAKPKQRKSRKSTQKKETEA